MKRKIFTFVAALAVTVGSVLPVSAAEVRSCTRPAWVCQLVCSPCPHPEQKPSVPEQKPSVPEQKPSVPETPEQKPDTRPASMSQLEWTACQLVNEQRQANGLEPLEISATLSSKARIKAQDMKDHNYFSHTSPTYGSPFAMMQTLGITYTSAAENIASGYKTAEAVVKAWMDSPSHRANILSTRYDTLGIGEVDGRWAQWFIR